ncbi:flagellar motor switch protein FliM [Sphingomonas gellani]|uniref:Flagellar motor switch protein FliM n=1 Tax=Sphingomonas gellani TaxID=1166340 RepID=A0A1H8CI17_9SPHN|nr:FliM/FliN family flagellar motor switch protein [Sphingomonas gellani]SEM94941.1 flagellar motor switch protein FliM [Sphingomonas gellani]
MVNAETLSADRRTRTRADAADHGVLGQTKLNPFGDLHTLQHLSARLARSLRGVFEPLLRRECRTWAEPLSVQRFADYRTERGEGLIAWLPLALHPTGGTAFCTLEGGFVMELLDLFFGGTGTAPDPLPTEFSPAAEAMMGRLGVQLSRPLAAAWEPLSPIGFTPGKVESNPALLGQVDGDDAMIVTRLGLAAGTSAPVFLDIVYPVSALKPHGTALTGKVVSKPVEPDPSWRNGLTRAAMTVRFPVRSVLAEPVVPLSTLIDLKPGDVIPISFGQEVPVMVGTDQLGFGIVGTANGQAAIRLTRLADTDPGQAANPTNANFQNGGTNP